MLSFVKYLYNESLFFQLLKKLSIYSIFILFLSSFLFPQIIDSISNDNTALTESFLELDFEQESESEEESEKFEETESDDLFQNGIHHLMKLDRQCSIDYMASKLPLSSLEDICTPPPEMS